MTKATRPRRRANGRDINALLSNQTCQVSWSALGRRGTGWRPDRSRRKMDCVLGDRTQGRGKKFRAKTCEVLKTSQVSRPYKHIPPPRRVGSGRVEIRHAIQNNQIRMAHADV